MIFFPTVQVKDYNVMIDGQNVYDQPVKNDLRIYYYIQKFETGQRDDYTTCCLLNYPLFKEHYKMRATDLSKQPALDADPKAIKPYNPKLDLLEI